MARAGATVTEENRRARPLSRSILVHGFILAVLVVYAAPIIGVLLTSVQTNAEIAARGVWHIPEAASLANFEDILANTPTPRYLLNSFLVTIPATAISILGGLMLGYVFSQFRFPFAELLFLLVIAETGKGPRDFRNQLFLFTAGSDDSVHFPSRFIDENACESQGKGACFLPVDIG